MDEILALLDQASALYHSTFTNPDRGEIFDAHMATTRMNVEYTQELPVAPTEEVVA